MSNFKSYFFYLPYLINHNKEFPSGTLRSVKYGKKNCKMDVLFSHHKGTCEDKYPCKDDEIRVADHRADTHFCKCVIGRFRSPLKRQQLFVQLKYILCQCHKIQMESKRSGGIYYSQLSPSIIVPQLSRLEIRKIPTLGAQDVGFYELMDILKPLEYRGKFDIHGFPLQAAPRTVLTIIKMVPKPTVCTRFT